MREVCGMILRITLPVAPGELSANQRDGVYRGCITKARSFRAAQASAVTWLRMEWRAADRIARDIPLRLTVDDRWPTAKGDAGQTHKAVLDAIVKAGILEDDRQVVEIIARAWHRCPRALIDVTLSRMAEHEPLAMDYVSSCKVKRR